MKPETELIRGIEEQTEKEILTLREEAERLERDRTAKADIEIEATRREIDERVETQQRRIDRAAKAAVATECHKIALEARERFFDQVSESVLERLRELTGSERYGDILKNWIVEAAIGLAAEKAMVSCSPPERDLCRKALPAAVKEASELIGRKIDLALSDTDARGGQGVVLTAASGRTAFNNQVRTRMLRRETAIRRIVYEELARAAEDAPIENPQRRESGRNDG